MTRTTAAHTLCTSSLPFHRSPGLAWCQPGLSVKPQPERANHVCRLVQHLPQNFPVAAPSQGILPLHPGRVVRCPWYQQILTCVSPACPS